MYQPTFASLNEFRCPEWYRDAKFGIWSHWGPQSVPMFGDWYARNMYIQDSEQYLYHFRHYGHPSKFGYKDICALWKAENFDAEALMDRYHRAGARFFVAQVTHHDHFFNYDSKLNRFNSVKVGPHKDICRMWKNAADQYHMPFGVTEHLGASFAWWNTNKGADTYGPYKGIPYDGNDPAFRDFYHDNYEHVPKPGEEAKWVWLTQNKAFREYWLSVMKEIIDLFAPDMLYSDSGLPFGDENDSESYSYGLEAVSYLYNRSIELHGENKAIYTQKDRNPAVYNVGILDIERSQLPSLMKEPWQSETCIGEWFYNARIKYKKPDHVIDILIDTISKNGTMLLNVLQRPDGTVDDQTSWMLDELEKWFTTNGEAVYGTRPWRVAAEGSSSVRIEGFVEEKVNWQPDDFRFVCKGNSVYAFIMCPTAGNNLLIRSIKESDHVKAVKLLGYGKVGFEQGVDGLKVQLPTLEPDCYARALEIIL